MGTSNPIKNIVQLPSKSAYETLLSTGTYSDGQTTITYNSNDIYLIPSGVYKHLLYIDDSTLGVIRLSIIDNNSSEITNIAGILDHMQDEEIVPIESPDFLLTGVNALTSLVKTSTNELLVTYFNPTLGVQRMNLMTNYSTVEVDDLVIELG